MAPTDAERQSGFEASFPEGRLLELLLLARDLSDFLPGRYEDWTRRVRRAAVTAWHSEGREQRMLGRGELLPFYALFLALIGPEEDRRAKQKIAELVALGVGVADGSQSQTATFEAAHHFNALGVPHHLPHAREGFPVSVLTQDPVFDRKEVAYELTHALFYTTRFGRNRATLPHHSATVDLLLIHLSRWSRAQDFDLTSELLLCLNLVQASPSALRDWAWSTVIQAQTEDGMVPGPNVSDGATREEHLAGSLHTTLVAALAAIRSASADERRPRFSDVPDLGDRAAVMRYATAEGNSKSSADRDSFFGLALSSFSENPAAGLTLSRRGFKRFGNEFDPNGVVRRHIKLHRHTDGSFGPFPNKLAAAGFSLSERDRIRQDLSALADALASEAHDSLPRARNGATITGDQQ